MALRDEILGLTDIVTEDVKVLEWGRTLRVRTLTAAERESWEEAAYGGDDKRRIGLVRAALVARSVIDEAGNRVFTDDDAAALATKSGPALERLYRVARRLSLVTEQDVEEIVKNS